MKSVHKLWHLKTTDKWKGLSQNKIWEKLLIHLTMSRIIWGQKMQLFNNRKKISISKWTQTFSKKINLKIRDLFQVKIYKLIWWKNLIQSWKKILMKKKLKINKKKVRKFYFNLTFIYFKQVNITTVCKM